MSFLLIDRDEQLATWAIDQIEHLDNVDELGTYRAVGVMSGDKPTDELLAVIIYHSYSPKTRTCQITGASSSARWASKQNIRAVLAIPFLQYNCNKVWTATPHKNERVWRFNEAIGFTKEGVLKDQFGPGTHAVICRMLKRDYDRLYIPRDWKKAA